MNRKLLFNILIYVSLGFLLVYLIRFDYFQISSIEFDPLYLVLSILFLWAGFWLSTLSWWKILSLHEIKISKRLGVISHGLSVFAKYIPGKIWVILGRAAKASGKTHSVEKASYASLKEQLLYIWLGLLLSAVPLVIFYGNTPFTWGVFAIFIFLSAFNFSDKVRQLVVYLFKRILKKELDLPVIRFGESLNILGYILVYWIVWILSFYFFSKAFYSPTEIQIGLVFPISVSLGVLAIITPGGIGIREGIMTGFMVLMGMPLEIATTISVLSRLWYMTGEVFIFLLAVILNVKKENKHL